LDKTFYGKTGFLTLRNIQILHVELVCCAHDFGRASLTTHAHSVENLEYGPVAFAASDLLRQRFVLGEP
jgi:hypothetical protein